MLKQYDEIDLEESERKMRGNEEEEANEKMR